MEYGVRQGPVTYRCVVHTCTRVVVRRTSTKAAEKAQERPHSQPGNKSAYYKPTDVKIYPAVGMSFYGSLHWVYSVFLSGYTALEIVRLTLGVSL